MPKKIITVTIQYKKDRGGEHPHIIVYYLGDDRITVGITHSKKDKKHKNYQLQINPLGGKEISYVHRHAERAKKYMFRGAVHKGILTMTDYKYVKSLANKKLDKK